MKLFPSVRYGQEVSEGKTRLKYKGTAIAATYFPKTREIVLAPIRWKTWFLIHTIWHELVHDILEQTINRARKDCLDELFDKYDFLFTQGRP